MIESVYKKKHLDSGIIYVLVNTRDKWINYDIELIHRENVIAITFYDYNDNPIYEEIVMDDDFDSYDYLITSTQEKDQITLVLVPRKMILDNTQWIRQE